MIGKHTMPNIIPVVLKKEGKLSMSPIISVPDIMLYLIVIYVIHPTLAAM